jgi:2-amino-4-hydroxy-6-hydroxymethyldihydropteridine diphosphokinase
MTAFGIALGSNLGDRAAHLRRGLALLLERLQDEVSDPVLAGRWYETDPVDCAPGAQAFLNSVVEMTAAVSPEVMHGHLQAVEQLLGRPAVRDKNAPRTLDLDLLYAGDHISDDPKLRLPHPRMHLRRFVLQPLADIRPDLVLPGHTCSVAAYLTALPDDPASVRLVGGGWTRSELSA